MEVLDVLFLIARVVLVTYSVMNLMFLLTGTTRTYAEWSKGFGGFLYMAGLAVDYANLEHIIPGRDVSRVMNAVGLAFVVMPTTQHLVSPRLYARLMEKC